MLNDWKPDRKIAVGSSAIGVAPLLAWGWSLYMPGMPMPPEIAAALGGVVASLIGYIVPKKK